ncbi:hypothetical protein CB0940_11352 [Cercospora beticola]|uniref:Uncharacterized protein n=1 Tax=Cercospora beticola TaxID=122368 RepID=A0A2G5HDT6_CERBT|nr:hypothetical protein CB0940_11352 [Cercospora beticola]PIA90665.1 hypothetical protein CB0940_11352 [Cercospora beticola]
MYRHQSLVACRRGTVALSALLQLGYESPRHGRLFRLQPCMCELCQVSYSCEYGSTRFLQQFVQRLQNSVSNHCSSYSSACSCNMTGVLCRSNAVHIDRCWHAPQKLQLFQIR